MSYYLHRTRAALGFLLWCIDAPRRTRSIAKITVHGPLLQQYLGERIRVLLWTSDRYLAESKFALVLEAFRPCSGILLNPAGAWGKASREWSPMHQ